MNRRNHVLPFNFSLGLLAWLCTLVPSAGAMGPTNAPVSGLASTIVSGTVVDGELSPLAGAVIALEQKLRVMATTTSDADGRYRFTAIAPGAYIVRVTHPAAPTLVRDLRVRAGATTIQLPLVLASTLEPTQITTALAAPMPPPPAPVPPAIAAPPGQSTNQVNVSAAAPVVGSKRAIVATQGLESRGSGRWQLVHPQPLAQSHDRYAVIDHNRFEYTADQPLSTFGADVDTASYANVRRFLSSGQLPPVDAVRIEEMLNYFHPDYSEPKGGQPLSLTTEVGDCPWAPTHKLVLVGARARTADTELREGRSLVLLVDVSGSMAPADRLPLIKTSLRLLVDKLDPDDQLAIVTYAGSSGVALSPTSVRERDRIHAAIDRLGAGGSTNGAQGIVTAYRLARQFYIPGGINRVLLATDGDFNVGVTGDDGLVRLIERERESGVFLSIFGVGTGNLNDSALEKIANKGNGHYVYLDSLQEARRVLLQEMDATLETVAKDVKFQVEFNPSTVKAWKLIGYENRQMAARDFNDDRKDGGELGAGHTVTVLYEIVPVGVDFPAGDTPDERSSVDPLKYQPVDAAPEPKPTGSLTDELMTVKARYKQPDADVSALIEQAVRPGGKVVQLAFASTVAEFGLLLRQTSPDVSRWDALLQRVSSLRVSEAMAADKNGFEELVAIARDLVHLQRNQ